jgi:hypothetical protein
MAVRRFSLNRERCMVQKQKAPRGASYVAVGVTYRFFLSTW